MANFLEFITVYKKYICLLLGTFLFIFSLGLFNISILIFIWPFLYLHYLHEEENKKKSILLICAGCLFANLFKWIGSSEVNIFADFIVGIYLSIITMIPFIIDKLLYKKIDTWRSALLFPFLVSSVEFIFAFVPLANVNIYAYSQMDNIQLAQMISLFGLYSLSFLLAMFSSLLDFVVRKYKEEKIIHKSIFIYLLVFIIFYIYGGIYLRINNDSSKIKVVSVLGISPIDYLKGEGQFRPLNEYIDYIKTNTKKAKQIDANLIIFPEESFFLREVDKETFINQVMTIAEENEIFISTGMDIETDSEDINYNSNVLISNKGERLYDYVKHHPIPLVEYGYKKGTDPIKIFETEIGKITNVICFDLNFPYFLNYIGFLHPGIVIAPSWDYKAVMDFQSKIAKFRAIENGFNIIKNTIAGIVISIDYHGRVLSSYRTDELMDYFVVSDVYKEGIKTLFSYIGLFFNYFFIVGIFLVIFIKISQTENEKKNEEMISNPERIEMELNA